MTQVKEIEKFFDDEDITVVETGHFRDKNGVYLTYNHYGEYVLIDYNTKYRKSYKYKASAEKAYKKLVKSYEVPREQIEICTENYYIHNENIEICTDGHRENIVNYYNKTFNSDNYRKLRRQLQALQHKDVFLFHINGMDWKKGEIIEDVIFIGENLITKDYFKNFSDIDTKNILFQQYRLEIGFNLFTVWDNEILIHRSSSFKHAKKLFLELVKNLKEYQELRDTLFHGKSCECDFIDCNCMDLIYISDTAYS